MTEDGMAELIRRYWAAQGFYVQVGVREVEVPPGAMRCGKYHYHAVRSTLANGLPENYQGELAMPVRKFW